MTNIMSILFSLFVAATPAAAVAAVDDCGCCDDCPVGCPCCPK
jgi:hypothetical protein